MFGINLVEEFCVEMLVWYYVFNEKNYIVR